MRSRTTPAHLQTFVLPTEKYHANASVTPKNLSRVQLRVQANGESASIERSLSFVSRIALGASSKCDLSQRLIEFQHARAPTGVGVTCLIFHTLANDTVIDT